MKKLPAKTADAIDLILEFSTLGEYGLEYPEGQPGPAAGYGCRPGRTRASRPAQVNRPTVDTGSVARPARQSRDACPARATKLPEALMPPRIRLDPVA